MIAVLVGQPCPKTCHAAPQPTLEEAFDERSLSRHRFLPVCFSSLLLTWLRRAQMQPLRIGSRMWCTVPPRVRGVSSDHANYRLLAQEVHIENSACVALILSRVERVTVPAIALRASMLRARPRGLRPQYSCGAGLLRAAQLPQVRCPVRVHPRDRRTQPRHKGAARFHVPRLCCSQTRPNFPPRVFDRREPNN